MDLKPSSVKINKHADSTVLDHSDKLDYNPLLAGQKGENMSPNIISKLIKDIATLKQDDHIMIYKMLRKHKDKSFFSSNQRTTLFDIRFIDNRLKWELHRFVLLCKDDARRKGNINNANDEYTIQEKRSKAGLVPKVGLVGEEINGISEADKYGNMLKMNST